MTAPTGPLGHATVDLAQLGAPAQATLAVVVAAAGGHHLWLAGSPGTGRVMLARAVHALLPDLSTAQARDAKRVTALRPDTPIRMAADGRRPPWQAPHHTASFASVIGGRAGGRLAPGAVSLAHHGVLFLEQAAELPSRLVHAIAAALRQRQIVLADAGTSATFPARFQLVMATEPCPAVVHSPGEPCTCGQLVRQRYRQRVAALAALCDLRVNLDTPASNDDPYLIAGRSTVELAALVATARRRARRRWRGHGLSTNVEAAADVLIAALPHGAGLRQRHEAGGLSTRGLAAVLRVGFTLADLSGRGRPESDDLRAALLLHGHG